MKRSRVVLCVMALCLFLTVPPTVNASPVGIITAIEGRADITRGDEPARPAIVGDEVHIGDFLRTLSKSRLEMAFIDDSVTRLAPLSRLRVTEYLFEAGERTGTIDLLRGKVQSVLVKATPDSVYEIHTPTAVAGVRGTTFFVYYRDGVTGGASREGTFYVYSKGLPDQVRLVRPGQAFLVMGVDEIPIVRPATEEELERHLLDTTIGDDMDLGPDEDLLGDDDGTGTVDGTQPDGDDDSDVMGGGDVAGDAQSGERYADATDPDTELAVLDPATEPTPEQTIPAEPPLPEPIGPTEPVTPVEPFTGVDIFGTSSNLWSVVNIHLYSASPATMGVSGEITDSGITDWFEYYTAWTVPVSVTTTDAQILRGIFAGTAGDDETEWFGVLPGFHVSLDGVLGYTLGMPSGTGSLGSYTFSGQGPADYVILASGLTVDFDVEGFIPGSPVYGYGELFTSDAYVGLDILEPAHGGDLTITHNPSGDEWSVWAVSFEGYVAGDGMYDDPLGTSWDLFMSLSLLDVEDENYVYVRGENVAVGADGTFQQKIAGSWVSEDDAITGVIGGVLKGVFDADETYAYRWHAVAGGISLGTEQFLSMAGTDQGRATLDQLNIPFVPVGDVGGTNLTQYGGSGGLSGVYMNDVRFFAYSSGTAPLIWATGSVGGTWTGTITDGDYALLSGPGFASVNFDIQRWDSSLWTAEVYGLGTVATHEVYMLGDAAGSYAGTASGTFTGTASGVTTLPVVTPEPDLQAQVYFNDADDLTFTGWLSEETMSLTGSFASYPSGGMITTVSDETSFDGYIAAMTGSWDGLLEAIYYDGTTISFLRGILTDPDFDETNLDAAGELLRTGAYEIAPEAQYMEIENIVFPLFSGSFSPGNPTDVYTFFDEAEAVPFDYWYPTVHGYETSSGGIVAIAAAGTSEYLSGLHLADFEVKFGKYGLDYEEQPYALLGWVTRTLEGDFPYYRYQLSGDGVRYMDTDYVGTMDLQYIGVYESSEGVYFESVGTFRYVLEALNFRSILDTDLVYFTGENFSSAGSLYGLLGGTGDFFGVGGSPVETVLIGGYSTSQGAVLIHGDYLYGEMGIATPGTADDGRFRGYFTGLLYEESIYGKMLSLVVKDEKESGLSEGGYIYGGALSGTLYPALEMWEASLDLTYQSKGQTYETSWGLEPEQDGTPSSSLLRSSLTGSLAGTTAGGTIQSSWLLGEMMGVYGLTDLSGIRWGLWSLMLGGYYSGALDGTIVRLGGGIEYNVDKKGGEYESGTGYWLIPYAELTNIGGTEQGRLSVRWYHGWFLTDRVTGDITYDDYAPMIGSYDSETWQATDIGLYENVRYLSLSGRVGNDYAGFGFYNNCDGLCSAGNTSGALLGGINSPWWGAGLQFSMMGPYVAEEGRNFPYLWSAPFFSYNRIEEDYSTSGGAFWGLIGGIWEDGQIDARHYSFFIAGSEESRSAGIHKGTLTGNYYDGLGMFEASGTWNGESIVSNTGLDPDLLASTYLADFPDLHFDRLLEPLEGPAGAFNAGGNITVYDVKGSHYSIPSTEPLGFGISQSLMEGEYGGNTSDNWTLGLELGDASTSASWYISVRETPYRETQWSDGHLKGPTSGYGMDISGPEPITWISVGEIMGTFNADATTWQAIQTSAWFETGTFLTVAADFNPEEEANNALRVLDIPCFEVGKATLTGSGNNFTTLSMEDVTFFASYTGLPARIWATDSVIGAYTAPPVTDTAIELAGGELTANFIFKAWNTESTTWYATIDGTGGFNGSTAFQGISAGTGASGEAGSIEGTAAGIAQ